MIKAFKDGWSRVLKSDSEMEPALKDGYDIYEDIDGEIKMLATPETGWLTDKPSFGPTEAKSEAAVAVQALDIIMNGVSNG